MRWVANGRNATVGPAGRHADSDLHNVCEASTAVLQVQLVGMSSAHGPIEVRPFVPLDTEAVELPMLLEAGSIVAYDSKVWHRGGANSGVDPRPVLYTTWMAGDDGLLPRNMGYTIPEDDLGAWTLARVQRLARGGLEPSSAAKSGSGSTRPPVASAVHIEVEL